MKLSFPNVISGKMVCDILYSVNGIVKAGIFWTEFDYFDFIDYFA